MLSDGVDSLAASIASGDLPPDTEVLPGQAGSGDEGTAMLEIVHDLAPNAQLAFATAFTSAESFADNIRALRAAGADIIVDDVLYFAESPFQDGPIAQAVIDVTDDGALYFSSAGNEQNVDDGTAGNYEGDFVSSGLTIGKFAGVAHDFDPGAGVQALNPTSDDSAGRARRSCSGPTRSAPPPTTTTCTRWPPTAPCLPSPTTCRTATTTPSRASTCRAARSAWPW